MVVSKRWFEVSEGTKVRYPFLPQFNLLFTSILPLFLPLFSHLFSNPNLTSASSQISNHGMVYRLLECDASGEQGRDCSEILEIPSVKRPFGAIPFCLPETGQGRRNLVTPAVESSIAVEDAVENRGLYRVFVSRLF